MRPLFLLMIAFAAVPAVQAQVSDPKATRTSPTQAVINEDRGRACIVVGDTMPARQPNGSIYEPQQFSIFLGKGWATDALRAKEQVLANLISNSSDPAVSGYFDRTGGRSAFSVNNFEEKLIDAGEGGTVSDLQIQTILAATVKDNPAAGLGRQDTIYVIYLEPSLTSTLGPIVGGKHYSAYHNAFNTSDSRLKYVVVPYKESVNTVKRRALIGLMSAIFQPACPS